MTAPRLRNELKYVVHHGVQAMLMARWARHLRPAQFTDAEARTPVLSQYYDSPGLHFYRDKLDGLALRSKVRLRVYDTRFRTGAVGFYEIKHRRGDKVLKVRERIENFEPALLDIAAWQLSDPRKAVELGRLRERYRLCPSAQVFYQRQAFEALVEHDLRVTWDTALLALMPGEQPTLAALGDPRRRMLPDTLAILEVKSSGPLPRWVQDGIVCGELRQQTVPKYVTAVETLGLDRLLPFRPRAGAELFR